MVIKEGIVSQTWWLTLVIPEKCILRKSIVIPKQASVWEEGEGFLTQCQVLNVLGWQHVKCHRLGSVHQWMVKPHKFQASSSRWCVNSKRKMPFWDLMGTLAKGSTNHLQDHLLLCLLGRSKNSSAWIHHKQTDKARVWYILQDTGLDSSKIQNNTTKGSFIIAWKLYAHPGAFHLGGRLIK